MATATEPERARGGELRRELHFWEAIALSIAIMAPTAAMAPDATMRKSRRVGSPWAPAGREEEAICVFAPLGRRNRLKSHALFKASSVAGSY